MTTWKPNRSINRPASARGFAALSPELGEKIWSDQIVLHDDGQLGYGGTRTFGVGGLGAAKTTLLTKIARQTYYIDGVNKNEFFDLCKEADENELHSLIRKRLHPETILWRGREFDVWNVLIPSVYKELYPSDHCKPLRVHIHKDSNLEFFHSEKEEEGLSKIEGLDIARYKSVKELHNNMAIGGHNIIYPPSPHYMTSRLKSALNVRRNVSKNDKKYLSDDTDYLVTKDIFLFEIFEYLYRANLETKDKEWYTTIIDESHDLFHSNSTDIYWHIIDCMVDVLIDTRKNNLSMAAMTHSLNLIDYRILERASHFIWLPGAKSISSYSTVDIRLVKKLLTGQGVAESMMDGKFGGITFDRIPESMERLVVKGANGDAEVAPDMDEEDDDIEFMPTGKEPVARKAGRPRSKPLPETIEI